VSGWPDRTCLGTCGNVFPFHIRHFETAQSRVDKQINGAAILALSGGLAAFLDVTVKESLAKRGLGWRATVLGDLFGGVFTFGHVAMISFASLRASSTVILPYRLIDTRCVRPHLRYCA